MPDTKEKQHWSTCQQCRGSGTKSYKPRKKTRLRYQQQLEDFERNNSEGIAPAEPKIHLDSCDVCKGTGLEKSEQFPEIHEQYPHVAIIGGGIG